MEAEIGGEEEPGHFPMEYVCGIVGGCEAGVTEYGAEGCVDGRMGVVEATTREVAACDTVTKLVDCDFMFMSGDGVGGSHKWAHDGTGEAKVIVSHLDEIFVREEAGTVSNGDEELLAELVLFQVSQTLAEGENIAAFVLICCLSNRAC